MSEQLPAFIPQPGVVIETARLRLRAHRDDDLAELTTLAGNWEVASWLTNLPHPYSEAHGREWIAHVQKAHQTGHRRKFAIAFKETYVDGPRSGKGYFPASTISLVRNPLAARPSGALRHNHAGPARHQALPRSHRSRG
jgi:RimJ/RimL family protein N-acetyltransferase